MVCFKCLNLTTLNFSATYDRDVPTCVICGGKQELHKAGSDKVDSKLPTLAQETGDLVLFAKLQTASDAHAGDVHYHSSCYNKLSSSARSAARWKAASATADSGYHDSFDNLAVGELAPYVVESKNVFHVNELVNKHIIICRRHSSPFWFSLWYTATIKYLEGPVENLAHESKRG